VDRVAKLRSTTAYHSISHYVTADPPCLEFGVAKPPPEGVPIILTRCDDYYSHGINPCTESNGPKAVRWLSVMCIYRAVSATNT
jgi:hypothetical protein